LTSASSRYPHAATQPTHTKWVWPSADNGDERAAEATRQAALSMGLESDNGAIQAWGHEMSAWFVLTRGDYRSVIAVFHRDWPSPTGSESRCKLHAQEAKAWGAFAP
jgi:hypothetical protein